MNFSKWVLLLGILYSGSVLAQAGTADSRDLLIDKLQKVQLNLAPNDPSKVAVTLRLADLYSERARKSMMSELEAGCVVCKAGEKDREKALALYLEVLDKANENQKGKVMIQVGHLNEMLGKEAQAIQFYQKIIQSENNSALAADAHLSLAEIYFKKMKWVDAKKGYDAVIQNPVAQSKGRASYRSALCLFNMGDLRGATQSLVSLLKNPTLLSATGTQAGQIDLGFQEEVARDLATLMGKGGADESQFHLVYELSPENSKLAHYVLLAQELERAGLKKSALFAWGEVFNKQSEATDRLETLAHTISISLDLSDKATAMKEQEKFYSLFSSVSLKPQSEAPRIIKAAIVNWNKVEKANPSVELLTSYENYSKAFKDDYEMNLWGAQVAKFQKNWERALTLEKNRVEQSFLVKNASNKETLQKLESALLSRLETAEESKNPEFMEEARQDYLAKSQLKTKSFEVQYQLAVAKYQKGQNNESANELYSLAMDTKGEMALRIQAANLALDAQAQAKNSSRIIEWSEIFAKIFPGKDGQEMAQVGQKARLNFAADLSNSNIDQAWTVMAQFDAAKASREDALIFYKNKIVLSQKRKDFKSAYQAALKLSEMSGLSIEDSDYAFSQLSQLSELQLDFKTSMMATEKINKSLKPDEKFMKLAMYSDLLGESSTKYLQQYLNATTDKEVQRNVAMEIIRRSSQPVKEMDNYKKYFVGHEEILAQEKWKHIWLSQDFALFKKSQNDVMLKGTASGNTLNKVLLVQDLTQHMRLVKAHQLQSQTQNQLAKSMKARVQLLDQLDKLAQKSIESKDWTAQVVALEAVSQESKRFYEEIMSLPLPQGLTPDEENQYMNLLGQQASPYSMKAEQAQLKANEFWGQDNWKKALAYDSTMAKGTALMLKFELAALESVATDSTKNYLGSQMTALQSAMSAPSTALAGTATKPNFKEIELARMELRNNPLNHQAIQNLINVEQKMNNQNMVNYLQSRLKALQTSEVK